MKKWNSIELIGFAFCVSITIACCKDRSINNTDEKNTLRATEQALALWKSWEIHDYSFTQTRECWYPSCGDTMRVVVKSDTIYSITPLCNKKVNTLWVMTINELFEIAQYDTTKWIIQVEFDKIYGFPKYLYFQPKPPIYTEGGFLYLSFDFVK